ncbi:MAG: hybrid sensor histidine kinase/response regulator [Nitrospiraceae bacterium]|nr:MAG: hybrid sensor histidine kinase/response regulator [Nitrospiraceae bacterium]
MAIPYDENKPLYGSRGIAIYLKLLRYKYSRVDIGELLQYAGMEPYQVTDESHLFSQKQINLFYEKIVELTGNRNIAREAGRFASSPEALGSMKGSVIGLLGPTRYYELIGKFANKFSKASHYEARRLGPNKVEIVVTPYSGTVEQPYQCDNRMGYWEAVSLIFSLQPPRILHPKCLFRGDETCHYIVSWKQSKANILRRLRNITAVVLGVLCITSLFLFSKIVFAVLLPVTTSVVLLLSWFARTLDVSALQKTIEHMRGVSDELFAQVEINYKNSQLVNEIGQALAKESDIDGLFSEVANILQKRLDFDRGMILLADSRKTRLAFQNCYGYPAEKLETLRNISMHLDDPESNDLFSSTFRNKQAVLLNDTVKEGRNIAPQSKEFLEELGTRSLLCCPIVYEEESLGVLVVENTSGKRQLLQRDINLLMGIASQIAARMHNMTIAEQLRQNQKMEAVGVLAGGVAHDFNNILTAILGYSQIASTKLPEDHPVKRMVDDIYRAGEKAADLTHQLLAFSRKQVMQMKVVRLNDIVTNMAKLLGRLIGEDVVMEIRTTEQIGNIKADAGQVELVLMNLVVNARDAMPCGGRLTIETGEVLLDEKYAQAHQGVAPGTYAVLTVNDTGEGMSPEVQKEIFEPFFTTKEMGKGTGLGLSTVYGIVKQHHGHIFVYSEKGKGTAFKIYFPVAGEPFEKSERQEAATMPLGNETILVVDDDTSIRKFVFDTLEPLGYRLLEASCGEEALSLVKSEEEKIDLLLSDVIMPGMNGRDLCERVKKERPAIKTVLMSGYTDNVIAHSGVLDPGIIFINKPLLPMALANKLRSVLDGVDGKK